eukprot:1158145-Pelagomonas_calceolata.AAC.5
MRTTQEGELRRQAARLVKEQGKGMELDTLKHLSLVQSRTTYVGPVLHHVGPEPSCPDTCSDTTDLTPTTLHTSDVGPPPYTPLTLHPPP